MEAINNLGLTTLQLECLNECQMYLQVTTLTEIIDNMGTQLLPQILSLSRTEPPLGLHSISHSTLQWPHVHPPSQTSWKYWISMICNIFTGSLMGHKLNHPLGAWSEDYQAVHFWHWQMSLHGSLLNQPSPHSTICAAMLMKSTRTKPNFSITVPTNQQFEAPHYPIR